MINEEKYKSQHHNKVSPPMDLSDTATSTSESERFTYKSKPTTISPEVIGRQMDEAIKQKRKSEAILKQQSELPTKEHIEIKLELSQHDLDDRSKDVLKFIKTNPHVS